jgi:hypothetical protein
VERLRASLGEYALGPDPMAILWPDLVKTVFRDSPREEHAEYLSPAARTIYRVGCFHGEVVNGGFSQFFSNSSGNWVPETVDALGQVGARLSLRLLAEARTLFPGSIVPRDREERCQVLFAFEKENPDFLERLDRVYYRDVDALGGTPVEDVNVLQVRFLRLHAEEPLLA